MTVYEMSIDSLSVAKLTTDYFTTEVEITVEKMTRQNDCRQMPVHKITTQND